MLPQSVQLIEGCDPGRGGRKAPSAPAHKAGLHMKEEFFGLLEISPDHASCRLANDLQDYISPRLPYNNFHPFPDPLSPAF
jgi:hypothetical protein